MHSKIISLKRDLALIFCALVVFFSIGLYVRPYLIPSEARYIELPRQMLVTHDWLTPRINGIPYFEKPPLFYWMQASIMQFFGSGEFIGRLASVITITLTCMITYATGRMLYGRLAGIAAATVLGTCILGYGLSRVAGLDAPVTLFITATLSCFLAAQKTTGDRQRIYYVLMYAAAALAVMTKGLIGMVIPGIVIGAWILYMRQWRILREAHIALGALVFFVLAAPWHILMAQAHPAFLNFYFIHEHFTRYLTDEHKRTAPAWFFIAVTFIGLLPWTGLLPKAIQSNSSDKPMQLFLLLWIVLPFIFFSASHSKLVPYIFPIFPPLAILLGKLLAPLWAGNADSRLLRMNAFFMVGLCVALIVGYQLMPMLPGKAGAKFIGMKQTDISLLLLPILLAIAVLGYAAVRRFSARAHIGLLVSFAVIAGITANAIAVKYDTATTKPLDILLLQRLKADDMVVAYNSYWQDIPVYLNRNITVVGWRGELGFGIEQYPETLNWMITEQEFQQRCESTSHAVYVFMENTAYQTLQPIKNCPLQPIASYGNTTLLEKISQ